MSYDFQEYPDREMLAMDLANRIAGELRAVLAHEDRALLAVPGGTSPGPVFDDLCAADLDWGRVDVMLSDERWVPEDSPRSNTALLKARLLTGRAASARYLPLYAPQAQPEGALDGLAEPILAELPVDVLLLGMGADMHTASLFPGGDTLTDAMASDAPVLVPVRAPGAEEPRVTLSARVLDGAIHKHVLIFGAEKRRALEGARGKPAQEAPINAVLNGATVHWAE